MRRKRYIEEEKSKERRGDGSRLTRGEERLELTVLERVQTEEIKKGRRE